MTDRRVAVIGGGISGLAAALDLTEAGDHVTVIEAGHAPGGKISASSYLGVAVDEGPDAFLARVPDAVDLAVRVGLGDDLVSPEPVGAAIWFERLHPIPEGLVLGMPGRVLPLLRTELLSWRGKARAALDLIAPSTPTASDCIGYFVRRRFGDEVHERIVDALVGSIYAADTDNFSLAEVPQLAALATGGRSVVLTARAQLRRQAGAGTATATAAPLFAVPRGGVSALVTATADAVRAAGGTVRTACRAESLAVDGGGFRVNDDAFDAVILATPGHVAAGLLAGITTSAAAAERLSRAQTADVIMVTAHVADTEWPDRLGGLSGYLVPKPVQRWVTAASFGSQKWAHWQPPGGGQILRISLGRDGRSPLDLDDAEIAGIVADELHSHLGITLSSAPLRITRWPGAFAQYRPHHPSWVASIESELPSNLALAGAAYHGIGIPACIRSGRRAAAAVMSAR